MHSSTNKPRMYAFRIEGQIDPCWADWFEGFEIHYELDAETGLPVTVLTGPVVDQSALHGILEKISRLNFTLRSVNKV